MRCTLLCKQPRIVRVEGFLTRDEASSIIALTQEASWLHNAAEGAQARKVAGRSNKWCCIGNKSPVLTSAIERACWLTGLTPEHAEEVQVVHYLPGEQYELHVDHYTDRDVKSAALLASSGGNRIASIFVYLSDCEAGGATHFPLAGVREAPVCGHALLWHGIEKNGLLDARTLHAGQPVESGEKWGMNIWLRQRPRQQQQMEIRDQEEQEGSRPWPRVGAPPLAATTPKARTSETLKERN